MTKPLRIFLSASGIGASLAVMKGVRVGRDALGRFYVTVSLGVFSGKWYLPVRLKTDWRPGDVKPGDLDGDKSGVVQALEQLGYERKEIAEVWDKVPEPPAKVEERLQAALRALAPQARRNRT